MKMTELQRNFIRRACRAYNLIILEELFGVPDEMSRVPDWAHSEIHDLAELLDKESENVMTEVHITLELTEKYEDSDELADVVYAYLRDLMDDESLSFSVTEHRGDSDES
jgi:hypothetical protein